MCGDWISLATRLTFVYWPTDLGAGEGTTQVLAASASTAAVTAHQKSVCIHVAHRFAVVAKATDSSSLLAATVEAVVHKNLLVQFLLP